MQGVSEGGLPPPGIYIPFRARMFPIHTERGWLYGKYLRVCNDDYFIITSQGNFKIHKKVTVPPARV